MIGRAHVAPQVAAKQPQAAVVPPRSESNRVAHETVEAMDPVTIVLWTIERASDFGGKFRRDPLIRIENENPIVGCLRDGPVLEVAARSVLTLDDSATQLAGDLERAIGRT